MPGLAALPSPACIVPNRSSVPFQGSPETGRRPKGEQGAARAGVSRLGKARLGALLQLIPPPSTLMCPQTLRPQEWRPG